METATRRPFLRGQARGQLFIDVGADPEGGGGEALGAQPRGRVRQCLRFNLACVGKAVGEQQHAFHAGARRICRLQMMRTGQPAA